MYLLLEITIAQLLNVAVSEQRKATLQPLIKYVQGKMASKAQVNLNFICTHNSRRSHLAQIWAQTAAAYFRIPHVNCFSGGTEETAVVPIVLETLAKQGFSVRQEVAVVDCISGLDEKSHYKTKAIKNPVYAIRFDDNALPIIAFSKKYDHPFNPPEVFAAIMTCGEADKGCPFIPGAEKRISITYQDPKQADNLPEQAAIYEERSLQIGAEMFYVFKSC